jgi:small subunit ribosomal protein S1
VSEISAERHIHHPQDVLRVGQSVKAQVIGLDVEKRQIRLSMKQLVPTGLREYLEEHKVGDVVSGRVIEQASESAVIELGEGIRAACPVTASSAATSESNSSAAVDLSSLTSMLSARWKGATADVRPQEPLGVGQVRSFRIVKLDPETETIEIEMA